MITSTNVTTLIFRLSCGNSLSCDKNFPACCTNTDSSIMQWKGPKSAQNSSLLLKPTPNLELLVNQLNNATPENNNDSENISSSNFMIMTKCIS